jgi:hypothetical protein
MPINREKILDMLDSGTEPSNYDFKRGFRWNSKNKESLDIVRDIIGFANTQDGGTLILGFDNKTKQFASESGEWWKSYDTTNIMNTLKKYCEPLPKIDIFIEPNFEFRNKTGSLVVLQIAEFTDVPIICKRNGSASDGTHVLKEGQLYIRTEGASTESIPSAQHLRELLGRALTKKSDDLLRYIKAIVTGQKTPETIAPLALYENEISETRQEITDRLRDATAIGYWEFIAYPSVKETRFELAQLRSLIENSTVRLRGWPFPFTYPQEAGNLSTSWQSIVVTDRVPHNEGYRLYENGLFYWKSSLWEDQRKQQEKIRRLHFTSTAWTITEMLLFLKRVYAERLAPEDVIHIRIEINGCKDRHLYDDRRFLAWEFNTCKAPNIVIEDSFSCANLKASWKSHAAIYIKRIYTIFNVEIKDEVINSIQDELLKMQI